MLALGSCLAGSGVLIAGLLALLFQHPNAPWWTRPQLVPMLICIPVAGMIGVGLAFAAGGLWQLVNGTGDLLGLLTLAAVGDSLIKSHIAASDNKMTTKEFQMPFGYINNRS